MTNQYDSHDSGFTSSGNHSLHQKFPESGALSVKEWAKVWDVDEETVRGWVKDFEIDVWGPSDRNYMIDAADFRGVFGKRKLKRNGKGKKKVQRRGDDLPE